MPLPPPIAIVQGDDELMRRAGVSTKRLQEDVIRLLTLDGKYDGATFPDCSRPRPTTQRAISHCRPGTFDLTVTVPKTGLLDKLAQNLRPSMRFHCLRRMQPICPYLRQLARLSSNPDLRFSSNLLLG